MLIGTLIACSGGGEGALFNIVAGELRYFGKYRGWAAKLEIAPQTICFSFVFIRGVDGSCWDGQQSVKLRPGRDFECWEKIWAGWAATYVKQVLAVYMLYCAQAAKT